MEGSISLVGSVASYTTYSGIKETGLKDLKEQGSGSVQENFTGVRVSRSQTGTVNTSRYWYLFGNSLRFAPSRGALHITGNTTSYEGFGVDTNNGTNGTAFDATGRQFVEFDMRGNINSGNIKIELWDFNGNHFEHWLTPQERSQVSSNGHLRIRLQGVRGRISKIQFVAEPNTRFDVTLDNIGFTN